ncbi:phosphotransferase family protein [Paenibacillus sp. NEAU-GSW1]|uniref:phosphotransferase family protein n=1 Tax=Paenibacillus sp. NEAU-GSW1 TaxID=2682486 RepID=UPI0012E2DF3C|nr:aminoglycoside phosphotransferase family protein [Paenibacillus sp. NEAU-GSW1]MUT65208.1 phosphotransferase [Paenibacillus sp. NEAU-GSW1]
MESSNKSKLSEEQLASIVKDKLGQSISSITELGDGWANMAYLIELADGQKVVLKAAPASGKKVMKTEMHTMRTEVEALRLAAGHSDIPVPRVLAYDPSCNDVAGEYFIMDLMKGTSLAKLRGELSEDDQTDVDRQLGKLNRAINSMKGERFGYFYDLGRHDSWKSFFQQMMDDVLTDGKEIGTELPVPYEEIEQLVAAHMDVMDDVTEPALVHWDLWDGNVLVDEGRVTGLIDFERAFWGDPLIEFYFGRFTGHPAFFEGYGHAPLTSSEKKRRALYDLYLDLLLIIECDYRGYENQDHIAWTKRNFVDAWPAYTRLFSE